VCHAVATTTGVLDPKAGTPSKTVNCWKSSRLSFIKRARGMAARAFCITCDNWAAGTAANELHD